MVAVALDSDTVKMGLEKTSVPRALSSSTMVTSARQLKPSAGWLVCSDPKLRGAESSMKKFLFPSTTLLLMMGMKMVRTPAEQSAHKASPSIGT